MCNCGLCCQTYTYVRVRAQERAVLSVAGRSDGRGPQFCAVWWHCTSLITPRLPKTRQRRSRSLIGVLCNKVIAIFCTISTYNAVSRPSPPLADGEPSGPQNMTIVSRRDGTASRSSTYVFLVRARKFRCIPVQTLAHSFTLQIPPLACHQGPALHQCSIVFGYSGRPSYSGKTKSC